MMNRKLITIPLLFLVWNLAGAQTFENSVRRNFWNDGLNAAGLRCDSLSFSNAEIGGSYEAGSFRGPSDPENMWTAGARARTVSHLKNFSMAGSFGFSQNEQNNVCGSMFMDSGVLPYDAVELTPGRKTVQSYNMSGSISVDLYPSLRIGASLDFDSSNAAKKKDLRYTDYALDLSFIPSVQYLGNGWVAGASFIFKRFRETLSAEQVGSAASAPFVFFDEGVSTGYYQEWTGSNVHLKESGASGHPVEKNSLGFGLQFSACGCYADAELTYMSGKSGEKQLIWYEFSGPEAKAHFAFRAGNHTVRAAFGYDYITNDRNVLDKETAGGVTTTVCYGSNRILESSSMTGNVEYEWMKNAIELRGRASAALDRTLATPMYPTYLTRKKYSFNVGGEGVYHISHFDIGLSAAFMTGSMTDVRDEVQATSKSDAEVTTYCDAGSAMKNFYYLVKESVTSPRLSADISLRYNFLKGLYAGLDTCLTEAFGLKYIDGCIRWSAGMKLGYNF